jgi:aspartate/methionine/tyrosine aminotransferase
MNKPREAKAAPRISRRGEGLGTENAFVVLAEVNALARQGRDIVSFCIGQPDFPTPANIQDAAIAAIAPASTGTRRRQASTSCAPPRRATWARGAA